MASTGASIRIFLPDGDPEGVRIVTRSHWTGSAIVCSRSQYGKIRLDRPELARPGVYLLAGPANSPSYEARIYVGEGDLLRDRIDQHDRSKDFWTRVVAFSSSDGALNKALIKYIESRLARLAADAGRVELENGNVPPQPVLSEADLADAEAFLADMLVIYPLMGVTAFEAVPQVETAVPMEDLFVTTGKAQARGREVGDTFVVFRDATLARVSQSLAGSLAALRASLESEGKVVPRPDGTFTLLQDRTFQSPSYAASFVLGRATNGRTAWKNAAGLTLHDLADRQLPTS